MILPKPTDAIHRAWLHRLLTAISDDAFLSHELRFKGGTYAAMRGILDRFSLDLDFDLLDSQKIAEIRKHLEIIFTKLGLEIKDQSKKVPQYFLKYDGGKSKRNTLLLDITTFPPKMNDYEPVRFIEIDRILYGHTISTMFANKLVAIMERFEKYHSIAGRDIFDIHTFFLKGFSYKPEIIEERTGKKAVQYMKELRVFIEKHVTQTTIDQDLNVLLPLPIFHRIRKILKQEVLMFLR